MLYKVSYIKSIDIWLTSCLAFLFASLIEFAIVNALARDEEKQNKISERNCRKTAFSLTSHVSMMVG